MAGGFASSPRGDKANVLNSWKEIANYMGRGVRTVQRYERNLHLPVRRIGGKSRKAVLALPQDLDAWLRSVALGESNQQPVVHHSETLTNIRKSITKANGLREQCDQLRAANHEILISLMANLKTLMQEIHVGVTLKKQMEDLYNANSNSILSDKKSRA
jgi:hypothetical protein